MENLQIIELYNARSEIAISETNVKYVQMLQKIAFNLLSNHEDSEEIVNDTYGKAWDSIPPQHPNSLSAYFGRITRNLSINRWHAKKAKKRYNGSEVLLSELADCVPCSDTVEAEVEKKN